LRHRAFHTLIICPVSVDLAVVAIELAADGLASESQSSWRPSVPNEDPALL
jgi:hypothetical protein